MKRTLRGTPLGGAMDAYVDSVRAQLPLVRDATPTEPTTAAGRRMPAALYDKVIAIEAEARAVALDDAMAAIESMGYVLDEQSYRHAALAAIDALREGAERRALTSESAGAPAGMIRVQHENGTWCFHVLDATETDLIEYDKDMAALHERDDR